MCNPLLLCKTWCITYIPALFVILQKCIESMYSFVTMCGVTEEISQPILVISQMVAQGDTLD